MVQKELDTPDYIFESSWEVCNKIGGIYTVLSTRAKTLQDIFKDNVVYIGPDVWKEKDNPDFAEDNTLLTEWQVHAVEQEQLQVRVGRWNVHGNPIVVLVDFAPFYQIKDTIYYDMWERFAIDSHSAYDDYDEACMFAYAAGKVMESLYHYLKLEEKKVVAHLNEWMLGMTVLYLRQNVPGIATVFTTHATSVGRAIAGNNKPLYDRFWFYNGDQMAKELNVQAKHVLEKSAAHHVDCFTTVSEITAKECEQLLSKKPDIITPNGFEDNFVPRGDEYLRKREIARNALIKVTECLTGESVAADSLLLAISGRYEYKNKGIDVFIEAMNRVRLARPEKQVIAFILVPSGISGPRADLVACLDKAPTQALPNPFYTHDLCDIEHDKVCEYLRHLDFLNQRDYPCKLIFVPSYLMGDDGIFNLPYYDLLIGMDLTVFPSYYEPWGYTPLESIAFGIPTITTNLAGFGIWAKETEDEQHRSGVKVIERNDHNYFEVAEEIKNDIIHYSQLNNDDIALFKRSARQLSGQASWQHFITYYLDAYDMALKSEELRDKLRITSPLTPSQGGGIAKQKEILK